MIKISANNFEGDMAPWIIEQAVASLTAAIYLNETYNGKGLPEEEVDEHQEAVNTILIANSKLVCQACGQEWHDSYLQTFILQKHDGLEKFLVEMGLLDMTSIEAANKEAEKYLASLAAFAFEPKAIAREKTFDKLITDKVPEEAAKKIAKRLSEVSEGKLEWKDFAREGAHILTSLSKNE